MNNPPDLNFTLIHENVCVKNVTLTIKNISYNKLNVQREQNIRSVTYIAMSADIFLYVVARFAAYF